MLSASHARQRQQRLAARASELGLDAILIADPRHVYYLTGAPSRPNRRAALVIRIGGKTTYIGNPPADVAADEIINFPSTLRLDQVQHLGSLLTEPLAGAAGVGFDTSDVASVALAGVSGTVNLDPILHQMRRIKDPDELEIMSRAIDATRAMYERARQIIEPGIAEIEVYNQLHATAVESFGEPMTALLGNDFACGVAGGMPRDGRTAQAGELYILDLGPAFRGYFADNCRAIAVGRNPTDEQLKAWQAIVDVFPIVESLAKPGARTRDIYNAIDDHFLSHFDRRQHHHLGHGVGLVPQEYPFLKSDHDDTLLEGELFTAEPGIYSPALRGGLRLENQYLVTASGVQNLTPFPLQLA